MCSSSLCVRCPGGCTAAGEAQLHDGRPRPHYQGQGTLCCESTEYHVHYSEDECVYVLSGKATVTIDDIDYEIGAGDFVAYPAGGLPHTMKNTGSEVLRCIVVGQRLTHDIADYPRLGKRLYRYGQSSDLVDISDISNPTVGKKT